MSLHLLDRLISDVIATTEVLMESDPVDLAAYQPAATSIEKQHASRGVDAKNRQQAIRPMSEGVHRSVC